MANCHDPITFGRGGSARNLPTEGFSFTEDVPFSWTVRPFATVDIKLPLVRGNVALSFEGRAFLHGTEVPFQQVFFYWNGLLHHFHTFVETDSVTFEIDRVNVSTRSNRLALVIPTARSPASLGLSEDLRELGLSIASVTLETA